MRVRIQDRDVMILKRAQQEITQEDIPWQASYQSKMRRLRKLVNAGLLERRITSRQDPNVYLITKKGLKVLHWQNRLRAKIVQGVGEYVKEKEK